MLQLTELFRRLISVGCLLVGVWYVCLPGPEMLVIEHVDFEKDFKKDPYFRPKEKSIEDYKTEKLKDRLIEVDPAVWERVFSEVKSGIKGQANQVVRDQHLYWLADVPGYDETWPPVVYVRASGSGDYYFLNRDFPLEIYGVDRSLVYPQRTLGWLLLLAGLLVYGLLPRAKRQPDGLYYNRRASVYLPDVMGLLMPCFFLALSVFIIAENSPGDTPLSAVDGGWWVITVVMWVMGGVFLAMLAISTHYAAFYYRLTPSAFVIHRGSSEKLYPWNEMESCGWYQGKRGRVLGLLLIIFARGPGAIGQGLLVALNEEQGIEIKLKLGKTLRIMANHLPDFPKILEALDSHQIKGIRDVLKD